MPLPPLGIFGAPKAAAATSFESIATVTVGSGGSSSVSFTSIPSTYAHLQVRAITRALDSNYALARFNSDSGSNYVGHFLYGDGSSATATSVTSQTYIYALRASSATSVYGAGIMDILDYANTNKYTTTRSLGGNDNNGSGFISLISGLWLNTSAISSIELIPSAGVFQQYSHFALYGIKAAA